MYQELRWIMAPHSQNPPVLTLDSHATGDLGASPTQGSGVGVGCPAHR